ncbi:MAG: acetyl-CoA carboxylase biotin carboxylase subunit [Planctomycetes bacterium]|nr:acetyl-CoA carboxylase biotin carboxylase subunit [Planctomycetota bacterium]
MFDKVLIANRGEIAVRVIRACRALGMKAVMVYSTADRLSRAVLMADEAYCIGEPEARKSYLDGDKILAVAKACGAGAIHPGYGFLSENAAFARKVEEAGIAFVGPNATAIDAMGDKINSRHAMMKAKVPVIPGIERPSFTKEELAAAAKEIGYPVMLKATAGGGGKGIRIVHQEKDLWSAYERSVGESEKAFGNGTVFVEKAVEGPHHIEFQIFGDKHGNAVHLFERECSVQRRHQKVVEESPSPFMTPELREKMGVAAVKAAQAIGYDNAGTVEFLVDKHRNFYFLEVNTRLQVEHPITELVVGVDLVVEQLRVAAGAKLSFTQEELKQTGHAIELRICAEDPDNNYLPDIGRIESVILPDGPGVRLDSALAAGTEVTLHYDPMLAKLIAWGHDRSEAIGRLKQALTEFKISGLKTNIPFLGDILRDSRFIEGVYDTSFLEGFEKPPLRQDVLEAAIVAAVLFRHVEGGAGMKLVSSGGKGLDPWKSYGRVRGARRL